jgi:hypothetical protein
MLDIPKMKAYAAQHRDKEDAEKARKEVEKVLEQTILNLQP